MVMRGDLFVRLSCKDSSIHLTFRPGGSMSLVGMLPPLCHDGGMLVDGGYSKPSRLFKSSSV
jgi:hypothetical protein